jgi:hypothetical protein
MQRAGRVEHIGHAGTRVTVTGWSHLPAIQPGRVISVSGDAMPIRSEIRIASRLDVAMITRVPVLVSSGFELELEYASADDAKKAASSLCILADDARRDARMLDDAPGCPRGQSGGASSASIAFSSS